MSETWQSVESRGQSTLGVWGTFAPGFTVGTITLASHTADVNGIAPKAQLVVNQDSVLNAARATRDGGVELINDLIVRLPKKLDGELPRGDALHHDLELLRSIRPTGIESMEKRGQKVVSVWKAYNDRLAAAIPSKPAFLVGGHALADLMGALTALVTREQAVEDVQSEQRKRVSALNVLRDTVDAGNKRWYAAWQGEFLAGSAEINALNQITTGSPTLPPTALQIAGMTDLGPQTVGVSYVTGGGDHASLIVLQYKLPNDNDFGHDVTADLNGQQVVDPTFDGVGIITFRTRATNATAEALSQEATITK